MEPDAADVLPGSSAILVHRSAAGASNLYATHAEWTRQERRGDSALGAPLSAAEHGEAPGCQHRQRPIVESHRWRNRGRGDSHRIAVTNTRAADIDRAAELAVRDGWRA
jgi:hypothetical protein